MLRQVTVCAALVAMALFHQALTQCVPPPGAHLMESFSSLANVGGLQHPSGMELILNENGSHVEAGLRDYAGEASAEETKLKGSIEETLSVTNGMQCEVTLSGKNKHGRVKIRGIIRPSDFAGIIKRQIGRDEYSHGILLKRPLRLPQDIQPTAALWHFRRLVMQWYP